MEYARKNPGKRNYCSAGNGSVQHIAAKRFKSLTGTRLVHIAGRGTGPMVTGLLAHQVDSQAPPRRPWWATFNQGRLSAPAPRFALLFIQTKLVHAQI